MYKTLVCRECAFAALVNEVSTHLAKRHRGITAAERRYLVKRAAELQNAKRTQADLGLSLGNPSVLPTLLGI